jgi:hypothetical protein
VTEAKFKVSLVYLIPVLASLIFGLGCAAVYASTDISYSGYTVSRRYRFGTVGQRHLLCNFNRRQRDHVLFLLKRKSVKSSKH